MSGRVAHIWKSAWQQAWKTTLSMLRNRGYEMDEMDAISTQEVMTALHENQEFTTQCGDIFIFITMEQKVGIKAVRKLQAWLDQYGLEKAIVVYKDSITPFAKQAILQRERDEGTIIQCFTTQELQLDLAQHQCVPHHQVLSEKEKQRILEKYSKDVTKYPKLLKNDPMARYYGLQPGNMVQITRQYECGTYLTYRVVH